MLNWHRIPWYILCRPRWPLSDSPQNNKWINGWPNNWALKSFQKSLTSKSLLPPGMGRKGPRQNTRCTNLLFDILEDTSVGCTFIFLLHDLINKGEHCSFLALWEQSCFLRLNHYQLFRMQAHAQQGSAGGQKVTRSERANPCHCSSAPFRSWQVRQQLGIAFSSQLVQRKGVFSRKAWWRLGNMKVSPSQRNLQIRRLCHWVDTESQRQGLLWYLLREFR